MKNKNIYLICMLIYISQSFACKAQLINNKVNLYAEYYTGMFHGKELINEENFIYPSLYNNLKNINGVSLKTLYNSSGYLSFGLGLAFLHASNWEYSDYSDYEDSKIEMKSITPILQFHTKLSETGFFNRSKAFIEIAPVIGKSTLKLSKPPFDIQSSDDSIISITESNDLFYGIKGSIGIEWALSQNTGFTISYSYQHNWVSSILYSDTHFSASQLNIGIIVKIMKDKRFLYKN